MSIIDAHVHVWTPDTDDIRSAPGYTKDNMKPAPLHAGGVVRALQARRASAGSSLIQMSFYGFDNSLHARPDEAVSGRLRRGGGGGLDRASGRTWRWRGWRSRESAGFRVYPEDARGDRGRRRPFDRMFALCGGPRPGPLPAHRRPTRCPRWLAACATNTRKPAW